jgi:hypothetical protein
MEFAIQPHVAFGRCPLRSSNGTGSKAGSRSPGGNTGFESGHFYGVKSGSSFHSALLFQLFFRHKLKHKLKHSLKYSFKYSHKHKKGGAVLENPLALLDDLANQSPAIATTIATASSSP